MDSRLMSTRTPRKISMTIPAEYEIWLPDPIKKILGIDDEDWLSTGEYIGDHSVEFHHKELKFT